MINNQIQNQKFNLEDRTLIFAKDIIRLCHKLPNNIVNSKLVDQIIRSSGSIGANYREANDSLGKKDFLLRLRISKKETKETNFWLELLKESNSNFSQEIDKLINECSQIRNIFSAIINKIIIKNNV